MTKRGRKAKSGAPSKLLLAAVAGVALVGVAAWWLASARDDGAAGTYHPIASFADVHGLSLDPQDSRILYVATHHGLVRGVDGRDWARVGSMQDDLMGFSMHPADGSTFWVSGHPRTGGNMGVRQSTDGGFTWEAIGLAGQVDFHAMAVSPADPARLWGAFRGSIQSSADGGRSWERVSAAPGTVQSLAGDPRDARVVYAATGEGVFASRDAGATWSAFASAPAVAVAFHPADASVIYAASASGVLKSTDGGATWSRTRLDPGGSPVGFLAIDAKDPSVVVAATYATGIYKSADSGATWVTLHEPAR